MLVVALFQRVRRRIWCAEDGKQKREGIAMIEGEKLSPRDEQVGVRPAPVRVVDEDVEGDQLGRRRPMGNPPRKHPQLFDYEQQPWGIGDFTYLDTLPISLADVAKDRNLARGVLCDYCFFGGPTRTTLRTDFP